MEKTAQSTEIQDIFNGETLSAVNFRSPPSLDRSQLQTGPLYNSPPSSASSSSSSDNDTFTIATPIHSSRRFKISTRAVRKSIENAAATPLSCRARTASLDLGNLP